ncbi:MAG TPA: AraC family transcriptional regulator [Kofleriaceae bacterium]
MLTATSAIRIGNAGMHTTIIMERSVRGTIVRRDKLAYDTRFAPAVPGKPENVGHVYLVVNGRYAPTAGEPLHGPVGLILADDEIERRTAKSRSFRTDGDQIDVIHLRYEGEDIVAPIGMAAGALALPAAFWEIARAAIEDPVGKIGAVFEALDAHNITKPAIRIHEEPERFRRLWEALRPLYETYGGTVSLKQLAASLDMSMRQVGRDAKDLAATFGFGNGFRDALLVLRLRISVLLLSGPDSTVAEVATAVGYGSPIAMARAFRDAGLPAPSAVQAALRSE